MDGPATGGGTAPTCAIPGPVFGGYISLGPEPFIPNPTAGTPLNPSPAPPTPGPNPIPGPIPGPTPGNPTPGTAGNMPYP